MGWIEEAPRADRFQVVGATANNGQFPVLAMAFGTEDRVITRVVLVGSVPSLRAFKKDFLRAYDDALRGLLAPRAVDGYTEVLPTEESDEEDEASPDQ